MTRRMMTVEEEQEQSDWLAGAVWSILKA